MMRDKRVLFCVFKPDKMENTSKMRELFSTSYPKFLEIEEVEFKCWWCDQERKEWGALYVFQSKQALEKYVASDLWRKVVPEKYGCVPTWVSLEVGAIISKKIIREFEGSWQDD